MGICRAIGRNGRAGMTEKSVFPSDILNLETAQKTWVLATKQMADGVRELVIVFTVPSTDGHSMMRLCYMNDIDDVQLMGLLSMAEHTVMIGEDDD